MGLFMWLYLYLLFISQLQFAYSTKLTSNSSSPNHLCPHDQSLALLHFKQNFTIDTSASDYYCDELSSQSSRPKTVSWNASTDCCTWDGVTCHGRTGHVIGLDLSCSQLQGTINPDSTIFNLSHLKRLNLAYNDFSRSQIPLEFGRFASTLTHLNLSSSYFSGQIPSQISSLSKLVSLDLSNVNISSVFPMNLSSSLKFLDLSWTGLHGALPDSISNMKSLNHLRLYSCEFSGSIPESIGNLTQISVLELSSNNFSGEFPSTISKLELLSRLDFSSNKLQGHIPNVFAKLRNMSYLLLEGNNFSGPLPLSIANLTQLVDLDLSSNSITGSIPSWLFALPSLVYLDAQSNRLTGQLQEFQYQTLERIILSNNELKGPIPRSIAKLVNLTSLYLDGNQLTGIVELEMFSKLTRLEELYLSNNSLSVSATNTNINTTMPNLRELSLSSCNLKEFPDLLRDNVNLGLLDLSYNQIRGEIPNWVRAKWRDSGSNMFALDLRSNFLQGSLPSSICNLSTLESLYLSHNSFNGAIPQCLGNFSDRLGILDLGGNSFSGAIPTIFEGKWLNYLNLHGNQLQGPLLSSVCDLSSLVVLDVSKNSFTGAIPHCLGNFSNLISVLDLRMNNFNGAIPTTFAKGNSLTNLNLNGNQLRGKLPRSLGNCTHLEVLDLGNNQINDTYPQWLGSLSNLQVLILRANRFHGSIRITSKTMLLFDKVRILDLSHNEFTGLVPPNYFSSFKAMIDVRENKTAGMYMNEFFIGAYDYSVLVTMKGIQIELVKILIAFTTIDLSSNQFEGGIPNSIGNLNSLLVLNLSHNNFVDRIPSVLRNLSSLESLDLSSNQLTGEIPPELTGITFLEVLNLSQNRLVGRIPRGPQFNTFGRDSYYGNPGLCGFPLLENCGDNETSQPRVSQHKDDSDIASGFTWKVVLMGYGCGTVFGLVTGSFMFFKGKPKWFTGIFEKAKHRNVRRPVKRARMHFARN